MLEYRNFHFFNLMRILEYISYALNYLLLHNCIEIIVLKYIQA